jgi:N-acetylglucosaminyldiphosphoundecaprenol N-acetyl-beta-D-mannosaminyltransferase
MDRDPALAHAVRSSEVILADGIGAVFATFVLTGVPIKRVTGIDLMEKLVHLAAQKDYGIYLLGAKQEVLDSLKEVLITQYPGLRIVGSRNGYFSSKDDAAIAEEIRESNANLLFVAMGTPAKERWIDKHFDTLGPVVSMGVGGSFDVISGAVKRAPVWMQSLGLEWFFRFMQEPRRLWRRYFITSFQFLFKVIGALFLRGKSHEEIG